MKTLPTYEEEAERLSREQGVFIPPTQLNQFSRAASKAMNAIVNALPYCTYSEYELVLLHRLFGVSTDYLLGLNTDNAQ